MTDRGDRPELVEKAELEGRRREERKRDEIEHQVEPPVVARLVVEIRSDGSRTIARGALEDVATGQRTAIEARGDSPVQLAFALARSLGQMPRLAAKALLVQRLGAGLGASEKPAEAKPGLRGLLGRLRRP